MTYDRTNGKYVSAYFGQTASAPNPNLATTVLTTETAAYIPFSFGSTLGLEQKADITALGNMNDCGECHVGGGGMEFIPKYIADGQIGSPLGAYAAGTVGGPLVGGAYPGSAAPSASNRVELRSAGLLSTAYTAFNYLIDIFGPKGDGKGATYAAKYNDFTQSGVLEMDCLTCHLKGYDWEGRKHAVRALGFDASRVTGAGFGTYSTGATPSTTVTYDTSKLVYDELAQGWKLNSGVARNILAIPASENCATCHSATLEVKYQVEWKKRGDFWGGSEVHAGIGCMGCHERNDLSIDGEIVKANVGVTGLANKSAASKKLGLCDPAKGGDSPYDAQWNAMDKVAFKNCADCHSGTAGNGRTYGAPNPDAAHAAKGLTALVVQKQFDANGVRISEGVANASHLDLMDCTVCHSKKADVSMPLYTEAGVFRKYTSFPITGGAIVDGTGKDHEGRLATHDTVNVEREMKDNYSLYWQNGKLFMGSFLTSFFWRDMNTSLDANNDGRAPGMDPILPTHVARIAEAAGLEAVTHDGVADETEIGNFITAITSNVKGMLGTASAEVPIIRLSALAVPFKWTHNVAPASESMGQSCADCHSAASTFLNKKIVVVPKTDFSYGPNQMVTYAKVNGSSQGTDYHPNVATKAGNRSIALPIFNTAGGRLNDESQGVQRAKMIYEGTFTTVLTGWADNANPIVGDVRPAVGQANSPWYNAGSTGTAGWVLKLQVRDEPTTEVPEPAVVERTFFNPANTLTNVAGLITSMNGVGFASNANFGFTITDGGEKLVITPAVGKQVRLNTQTDSGPLGLTKAIYVEEPMIGVDKNEYATRSAWVDYFNTITPASVGIGIAPVADIDTVGGVAALEGTTVLEVTKGTATALVAADAGTAGSFTYRWIMNDGGSVAAGQDSSYNFPNTGLYNLTLNVVDEEGLISSIIQKISVVDADPITVGAITTDAVTKVTTVPMTISGAYDKVVISWGDGATTTSLDADGSIAPTRKYLRYAKYYVLDIDPDTAGNQSFYRYYTNVKVYNGATLVTTKNITVLVAP